MGRNDVVEEEAAVSGELKEAGRERAVRCVESLLLHIVVEVSSSFKGFNNFSSSTMALPNDVCLTNKSGPLLWEGGTCDNIIQPASNL